MNFVLQIPTMSHQQQAAAPSTAASLEGDRQASPCMQDTCEQQGSQEYGDSSQVPWRQLLAAVQRVPRAVWDSGMTCSFLASLIFSFSALFVKLTADRVPVLEMCFIRSSISWGMSVIVMHLSGLSYKRFFGQRKSLVLLFLRGCCGACSMITYYVALFMLPLGDAVTLKLIGPPVTAVFARLLLNEPLGYTGMVGCLISFAGVALVARPPFLFGGHVDWPRTRSLGTMAGVVSAVLSGGSSMTIRLIGGSEPAAVVALWFHTATLALCVIPLAAGFPDKPVLLSHIDGVYMLGVACTSFAAQLLSTRGMQRCQAAKAAAMGFTQVVYSHIMGFIIFHDKPTLGSFFGALLILFGVLMVTLRASGAAKDNTPAAHLSKTASTIPASHSKEADSEDQTLLPTGHVLSHLGDPTAGTDPPKAGEQELDATAVAVIRRRTSSIKSDTSHAEARMLDRVLTLANVMGDTAGGQHGNNDLAMQESLLSQLSASAAAALGDELCPAGSTAVALDLSRQISRQISASEGSEQQLSQQPSLWLSTTTSAFLTGPGLVWQQPLQQQGEHPVEQPQETQQLIEPQQHEMHVVDRNREQVVLPGSP